MRQRVVQYLVCGKMLEYVRLSDGSLLPLSLFTGSPKESWHGTKHRRQRPGQGSVRTGLEADGLAGNVAGWQRREAVEKPGSSGD